MTVSEPEKTKTIENKSAVNIRKVGSSIIKDAIVFSHRAEYAVFYVLGTF